MRVPYAALTLLVALVGPAVASEPSSHVAHEKATRSRTTAGTTSDLLPVPSSKPPASEAVRHPVEEDKSLHFGNVTVTPGGFLDVGTGGGSGRN